MRQAVSRTRESLSSRLEGVLALTRTVDEADFEELESALLTSDLGLPTTTAILEQLRDRALRQDIAGGEELRQLLNKTNVPDFDAVARTGVGVFDTLKSVAKLVLTELKKGS